MNKEGFIKELKNINIEVNDEMLSNLEKYYQILKEENEKYNLTAITDVDKIILNHYAD